MDAIFILCRGSTRIREKTENAWFSSVKFQQHKLFGMCDSRQAAFLDLPIMVSAPYAHAKKIARFFTRRSLPSLQETHWNFLDKRTTILSEIFFVFVSIAHYRARQKNGSQVARIFQARPGSSGKQQQEQNSRNLGTVFLPGLVHVQKSESEIFSDLLLPEIEANFHGECHEICSSHFVR